MRRHRITILFVAALVLVANAGTRSDPAHNALRFVDTATPAATSDSISVLLERLDSPREITISSTRNVFITSEHLVSRAHSVTLRAHGDRVEFNPPRSGVQAVEVLRTASIDLLRVRAGSRFALIPGTLRVTAVRDRLRLVARIAVSDYLAGVLAAESAPGDPTEYLVALTVLQRNYIAAHRSRHGDADVCDNTHCQLLDLAALARGGSGQARLRAIVARASTIDLGGDQRPSYYSACCGGGTLTPADVWGRVEEGYSRVTCTSCAGSRWRRWKSAIPRGAAADAVLRAAPAAPFVDDDFKIRAGRALGWRVVPGNTIDAIERRGDRWVLHGRGFGHRVGLCQAGARELARRSRRADEILHFYFPQSILTIR